MGERLETVDQLVGETVEKTKYYDYYILIKFESGNYIKLEVDQYAGAYMKFNDGLTNSDLLFFNLITQEEIAALEKQQKEEYEARDLQYALSSFNALKERLTNAGLI